MRIAICMHGVTGGCGGKNNAGDPVDIALCKRSLEKKIVGKNGGADFFVHSWTVERADEILDLYEPKDYVIEPQIIYSDILQWQIANSRWHSARKSLDMKRRYEEKHNFKYDIVMTSRFDIVWKSQVLFKNYDIEKFYASTAPISKKLHIEDFWFFSSSKNMDCFRKISNSIKSKNNHKTLAKFLNNSNLDVEFILTPPKDYDLYRWWSKKDKKYPAKWYDGVAK